EREEVPHRRAVTAERAAERVGRRDRPTERDRCVAAAAGQRPRAEVRRAPDPTLHLVRVIHAPDRLRRHGLSLGGGQPVSEVPGRLRERGGRAAAHAGRVDEPWTRPVNTRSVVGTPAASRRRAYAIPSSRRGSKPATTTQAGATPLRSSASSGDARGSRAAAG